MTLCILVHTSDYRGDHGADVELAYDYMPGETLESLVERVQLRAAYGDYISIRISEPRKKVPG